MKSPCYAVVVMCVPWTLKCPGQTLFPLSIPVYMQCIITWNSWFHSHLNLHFLTSFQYY
jgi:hypothetical protein